MLFYACWKGRDEAERGPVGFAPRRFSGLGGRHDLSTHNFATPTLPPRQQTIPSDAGRSIFWYWFIASFVAVYVYLLLFVFEEEEE